MTQAASVFPPHEPIVGYGLTNAFGSLTFEQPVALATPLGETNRLFVVERAGRIMVIPDLRAPTAEVFLDLREVTESTFVESGMLGLAFHPGFATNGFFFVFRTMVADSFNDRLSRFQVSSTNSNRADLSSEVVFISQYDESNEHNAGDLHFGPDGYLYISVADHGPGPDELPLHDQAIDKGLFGGILRIDVDRRPGNLRPVGKAAPYSIPVDNPFVGATQFNGWPVNPEEVRTEFYAVGFRNPFRFCVDELTGDVFAGDVGNGLIEEINHVHPGQNFGWPFLEGDYPASDNLTPPDAAVLARPLYSYFHGLAEHEGRAVIGGRVFHGSQYPDLKDKYVFGDFVSGHIWWLEGIENPTVTWLASDPNLSSFGIDPSNGDLLVTSLLTGRIRRLVFVPPEQSAPLPQTLAATGIFRNLATLDTVDEFVPYDVNVTFWSDFALKKRWFSTEGTTGSFGFSTNDPWSSPIGARWVKHFDMEAVRGDPSTARRLETRVLIRVEEGVYGLSYQWDENGENATLVSGKGLDKELLVSEGGIIRTQIWHFPGRRECLSCHNEKAGYTLGFSTAQLNRTASRLPQTPNQIDWMAAHGYLTNSIPSVQSLPHLVPDNDVSWPVEYRARSYLAANCQNCHQPGGISRMLWDGRISTPLTEAGLIRGTALGPFVPGQHIIEPNSLPLSLLYYRAAFAASWRMPPLGTSELNADGSALLQQWIEGMPDSSWNDADLGEVGLSGSTSIHLGVLAVGGAGLPLSLAATNDNLHWISRPVGPVSQVAGKLALSPASGSAGLMMRFGPESNGPLLALQSSTGHGLDLLRRNAAGSPLELLAHSDAPTPWLKLARHEDGFIAQSSADGILWTVLGKTAFDTNSAPSYAGIFTASGDTNRLIVSEWSNVLVEGLAPVVKSPSITLTVPAVLSLSAEVQALSFPVPLTWLANGQPVGTADQVPHALNWTNTVVGAYELEAVLRYGTPFALTSAPVQVMVTPQVSEIWFDSSLSVQPADLSVNRGLEGSLYSNSDGSGAGVAEVLFDAATNAVELVDPLGQPVPNAWGKVWQGGPLLDFNLSFKDFGLHRAGFYFDASAAQNRVLKISFFDAEDHLLGRRQFSIGSTGVLLQWELRGSFHIRIEGLDGLPGVLYGLQFDSVSPPRITLISPLDDAIMTAPTNVPIIFAIESLTKFTKTLEFYANGTLLGGQTNSPTSFQWNQPPVGDYKLEARLVDQFGLATTSPPVEIRIQSPVATASFMHED